MSNRNKRKKNKAAPKRAFWEPAGTARAACSDCGFQVETERAVETGWARTEYVAIRYPYCPICGSSMQIHETDPGAETG